MCMFQICNVKTHVWKLASFGSHSFLRCWSNSLDTRVNYGSVCVWLRLHPPPPHTAPGGMFSHSFVSRAWRERSYPSTGSRRYCAWRTAYVHVLCLIDELRALSRLKFEYISCYNPTPPLPRHWYNTTLTPAVGMNCLTNFICGQEKMWFWWWSLRHYRVIWQQ